MYPTSIISLLSAAIIALESGDPTEACRLIQISQLRLALDTEAPIIADESTECTDPTCMCASTREWLAAPADPDRWNVHPDAARHELNREAQARVLRKVSS